MLTARIIPCLDVDRGRVVKGVNFLNLRDAGDPVEVYADPAFAAQTLGWQAQYSLDDIIATAWQWHSTHIDGYTK